MSETSEPRPVQVSRQRCIASDETVDAHIEFLATDQKRVDDVALDDVGFSLRALRFPPEVVLPLSDLLKFVEQEDALALRFGYGLHNPPDSARCLLELLHKEGVITWQVISGRVEIVPKEKRKG